MNILAIDSCSGLSKPKSGGQNRFYNLVFGLNQYNSVKALIPRIYRDRSDKFQDMNDKSMDQVSYFITNLGQQTFNILTDLNPHFIIKLSGILRKNSMDLIHISHPFGVFATWFLVKLLSPETKIVLDAQDVGVDLMEVIDIGDYKGINKLFTRIYILLMPLIERIAVNRADHVLTVSKDDKKRFITKYGIIEDKLSVVPSGVNISPSWINDNLSGINDNINRNESNTNVGNELNPEEITIFFHGSYFHPPNRKAVGLIRDFIAPQIPDAEFIIAGYQMPVFSSGNVKSIGFVEDLYSEMDGVDMAIVPIKEGSGTRLKIMDYFMKGLPVISTKKGIEGIEAHNMENAIIVDDVDDEFIEAINHLLENPEQRILMGENNIRLVLEKYDYQKITRNLHNIYCDILSEDK